MIDLESVRLFILAVELGSLTKAAEAAGTVQPVVSQKLKMLEQRLGRRLIDRSPRHLRLTEDGQVFLPKARELLAKHEEALTFSDEPPLHFALAASDHAIGNRLSAAIRAMRASLPANAVIDVTIGFSRYVRESFASGLADAAIIRRNGGGTDGEVLRTDRLAWRAAPDWRPRAKSAIPLVSLGPGCGVRDIAISELGRAGIGWRDAFTAGSCAALHEGVLAGAGVAALGDISARGLPDRSAEFGLPPLPPSDIVLLSRARTPAHASAIRALVAAVAGSGD
ncbi:MULTISPECIES: LysR family transcriptional regulator [unclassified Agrobacterium]|uniref:LysR family transcriptional regulator n=1 Tax=unclassified Agrobacterium TaxID=2632611 RepID=UPI00244CC0AA|nr:MULTISPECIES: LysR family transcriptional regulator [unclassified Agrobacterium]MDH0614925.1 LysR family transcriptional regulator [Agrobacterium sp. GD03872]MDH0699531.1 LysR family transcriptional regulator [Agrobacterium sp. GD03871]MDH1061987.1 LysR family transcriptional regulator [Agrobacterium sp. GD03992]MDH2211695.1 LysR family transcriptional regulator [Agrobacterium sp. GD03643]MDH2220387.1 LysR family transcriptional regulator [Agrobacterium sp. GD03638]